MGPSDINLSRTGEAPPLGTGERLNDVSKTSHCNQQQTPSAKSSEQLAQLDSVMAKKYTILINKGQPSAVHIEKTLGKGR